MPDQHPPGRPGSFADTAVAVACVAGALALVLFVGFLMLFPVLAGDF